MEDLFFTDLSRFQRLYAQSLSKRLSPYGVQPGYLTLLRCLWKQDGETQKQLNARLDIEQATLSYTLKRMERDGLINRLQSKHDRRRFTIHLTDKGKNIQLTVQAAIDDLRDHVNKGLTINDRRYFKRIMRQMTDQLTQDQEETVLLLFDEVADDQP